MCEKREKRINYISPSLLNSWLYVINSEYANPQDFLDYLNRVEKETTEAQQKGLDFEDKVYKGEIEIYNEYVKDGLYQVKVGKFFDNNIFLLGIIDVLQPNRIYDIKTTKNYEVGKYFKTSQHIIYPYCTGVQNFSYLINEECYKEDYVYKEGQCEQLVNDFLRYLKVTDLFNIWKEKWYKTEKEIEDYAVFW